MKKLNTKYFTVAVYALAVLAFSIVFLLLCINFGVITSAIGSFLSAVSAILYAIFFAFLLVPAVKRLDVVFGKLFCRKKPHPYLVSGFSIGFTFLIMLGVVVLTVVVIIPMLIDDFSAFTSFLYTVRTNLDAFVAEHAAQTPWLADLYESAMDFFFGTGPDSFLSSTIGTALSSTSALLSSIFSQASNIFLGLIISVYLLASRRVISGIMGKLVVAFIPEKHTTRFVMFFKRLYTDFCAFAFNRILVTFGITLATYLLCLVLNVRLGSVVVLIMLVSHLIPVIGPIIGTMLSVLLVFLLSPGGKGIVFAVLILALEILATNLVLPHLLPKKLRPNYGLTAVIVLLGLSLFGLIGAFLAVPLYATLDTEFRQLIIHRLSKKKLPVSAQAYEDFDYNIAKEAEEAVAAEKSARANDTDTGEASASDDVANEENN